MRWSLVLALALAPAALATDEEEDAPVAPAPATLDFDSSMAEGFAPRARPGRMSATVGGAQDAAYYRDQAASGRVPRPAEITVEGLLSEHDLPLSNPPPCERLICAAGQAMAADLVAQPEIGWMAQLGFTSRLDSSFVRSPLNLVVVVDESGSMSGKPLQMAKESLLEILDRHLTPKDQISIVTFADVAHVELSPTSADQTALIRSVVQGIAVDGGTHLDAGLAAGLDLAASSRRRFDGQTRILLLTDERPNIGRTDAGSFKARLTAASEDGIGLTTIGVGVNFGAQLAQEVASVRGANLVYFPDPVDMKRTLAEDFDTLMTPLAYDMDLVVRAAPGLEIAGIYGIPGDAVERLPDGSMHLHVATLFASKGGGGIFFGFSGAPSAVGSGGPIASVELGYDPLDGPRSEEVVAMRLAEPADVGMGLVRGWRLVDQITAMRTASMRYHDGQIEPARDVMDALARRWIEVNDPELAPERALIDDLRAALGRPEPMLRADLVSGLPR